MTTNNEAIQTYLYEQAKNAILNFDEKTTPDIYAISLWITDEIDPREIQATVGYNTRSHLEKSKHDAKDEDEARWNFAFWLQNEETILGGDDAAFQNWVKSLDCYYTDEEASEDIHKCLERMAAIKKGFANIVIDIARRLHADGVIKTKFGRDIPIIIHELEYYADPLDWTSRANPNSQATDFIRWMTQLYPHRLNVRDLRLEKAYSLDWENKVFMSEDMKPVEVYKGMIDELVHGFPSTSVTIRSLLEKDYVSNDPSNAQRCFLASLTPQQRELLALMFLNEREAAIFDVMELLTYRIDDGVRLTYNGEIMPTGISGEGLSGDYTARRLDAQGDGCNWEWPEDLSMATK